MEIELVGYFKFATTPIKGLAFFDAHWAGFNRTTDPVSKEKLWKHIEMGY